MIFAPKHLCINTMTFYFRSPFIQVYTWGKNNHKQLGHDKIVTTTPLKVRVSSPSIVEFVVMFNLSSFLFWWMYLIRQIVHFCLIINLFLQIIIQQTFLTYAVSGMTLLLFCSDVLYDVLLVEVYNFHTWSNFYEECPSFIPAFGVFFEGCS